VPLGENRIWLHLSQQTLGSGCEDVAIPQPGVQRRPFTRFKTSPRRDAACGEIASMIARSCQNRISDIRLKPSFLAPVCEVNQNLKELWIFGAKKTNIFQGHGVHRHDRQTASTTGPFERSVKPNPSLVVFVNTSIIAWSFPRVLSAACGSSPVLLQLSYLSIYCCSH
jgi:hypothetical protein